MTARVFAFACFTIIAGAAVAHGKGLAGSPKSDLMNEAAIRKLYDEFTVAWNRHDTKALARMWTEDGDHVEPDGHLAKGRIEIERLLTLQHQTVFKDTHLTLTVDSVWFITGDVALVDGSYEVTGVRAPDGTEIPARKGRLSSIFLKEQAKWLIVASRLMIPAPLPWRET